MRGALEGRLRHAVDLSQFMRECEINKLLSCVKPPSALSL